MTSGAHIITVDVPRLETDRLRFRPPSLDDFEAEAEFYASKRSAPIGGPLPREEVWRKLAAGVGHWFLRGYGRWAIDDKETGAYCGQVGLWFPEGWPEPEIGWHLMEHVEGRGLALEAAVAVRSYAYASLGWSTAISLISPGNERSIALATRLGAWFETIYAHPSYGDLEVHRHPGPGVMQ